jgi:hypothetical protein
MRVKNKKSGKFVSAITDEGYMKIDQMFKDGKGTGEVSRYLVEEYLYSPIYAYRMALERKKRVELSEKLRIG